MKPVLLWTFSLNNKRITLLLYSNFSKILAKTNKNILVNVLVYIRLSLLHSTDLKKVYFSVFAKKCIRIKYYNLIMQIDIYKIKFYNLYNNELLSHIQNLLISFDLILVKILCNKKKIY